ncbi:MAG TPA: ABC transporter permease [Opitutaceae bacterium]|nr:ABC transporter permease [Opitutaceae bacterium]
MPALRYAVRSLLKSPGFTVASVLILALGLGAITAIFSVLYAVLLRPFPYPDADQMVVMWQKGPQMEMSIAWPTVQDWQKEQQAFSALAVHRRDRFNLSDPGQLPDNINGAYASPEIFDVARLRPVRGRYFSVEDNQPGAAPVVVISEKLWHRRFQRREDLLGTAIPVDGVARTVIGIAPEDLNLPRLAELWVPIGPYAATQPGWQTRGNNPGLYSFARIKPGLSVQQAEADMERIYAGLRVAHADNLAQVSARVQPYRDNQLASYRTGLWALLAATGLVLAIACANVASLFITRGMTQQRDYAVRSALGASRGQLIRQMLLQSVLVALAGGALSLLVAAFALDGIRTLVPWGQVRFQDLELNGWVLAFCLVAALVSGVLAGLWPAFRLARADPLTSLHEGSRGATAGSTARRVLVGAQVALTLVLLSVTGLMLRSLQQMRAAPLGFDSSHLLIFSLALPENRYPSTENASSGLGSSSPAQRFYQRLVDELRALPGVTSAAVNTTPPLHTGWQSSFAAEGHHAPSDNNKPLAEMSIVSDDYFSTLKVPLVAGRAFGPQDATGPRAVIIDQAFANKYWPGQDPIGKRVNWGVTERDDENWFTVVGVVPTLKVEGYGEPPSRPQAYWSLRQFSWLQKIALVRTEGNPRLLERPVRELLAKLDPEIALYGLVTMEEEVASTYQNTTLQSTLLSLFAALALLLALTGLYSVVAYGVTLRRREIGIRMALGAMASDVVGVMLRQGLVPLGVGLLVGLAGALAAGRAISTQLYQVTPYDPLILCATAALLAAAAGIACYVPARKATRVNPVEALRTE